jgi:type IV pilus assembly protein PilO
MKLGLETTSIPKKYRLPLIVLLGIGILIGGYFLLLKPQFEELSRLEAEKTAAETEVARLTAIKNNIGRVRVEYTELQQKLEDALRQMPEEKEIPGLLRQVSLTASESKTKVKYFAPKQLQTVDFYAELPFEMKFSAPYHNIGYFFDGIRKLERIVHITGFTLETKGAGDKVTLEGTCTAKAYVLSKQAKKETPKPVKKETR